MAAAYDDVESRSPSISEAVEQVGFGKSQLLAGFLGGGVYLVGGVTLLLASCLSETIGHTWQLRAWERAALMSTIFTGMLIGNSSSGPLGDSYGRRGVIIASHLCSFIFGLFSVFAQSFTSLCFWRFMLGASLGLGVPPWMVLCTEITPASWRIASNAYSQILFVFGEIYSALLILWSDPTMRRLEWRSLTAAGLVPAFLLAGLAWMFLLQSPSYLASKGEYEEARNVLVTIARQNGAPAVATSLRREAVAMDSTGSFDAQFQALFGKRMRFSTFTIVYICFVLNLVFYGVLYGLPQVAENVDTGTTAAVGVLLGAFWELPGLAAGAMLGTWFRRLPVICWSCMGMACAMGCFGLGVSLSYMWFSHYLIQGSLLMIKMVSNIAFVVVYQYASEIYPVFARTTGSAFCVSGGRLGAILSPVMFESLAEYTGSFSAFFVVSSGFAAVSAALSIFLPFETAGQSLDAGEMEPALTSEKTVVARKLGWP